MKKKGRGERKALIISIMLTVIMCFLLIPNIGIKGGVYAAGDASGKDKYSLDWSYTAATKTLTIKPYKNGVTYDLLGRNDAPIEGKYNREYTEAYGWYSLHNDIERVVIQEGIRNVGQCIFYNEPGKNIFPNLKTVSLPSTIKEIDEFAFYGCTSLTTINFPNGLEKINESAFADCTSLSSIVFPNTISIIRNYAFSNSGLTELSLPEPSETTVFYDDECRYAFSNCLNLKKVTLGRNHRIIASGMFKECTNLETVNSKDEDGISYINGDAFNNCKSLKEINNIENASYIGNGAFMNCTSLKEVTLRNNYSNAAQNDCFKGCSSDFVMNIVKPSGFYDYAVKNGIKYNLLNGGKCTDGIEWSVDEYTGELLITGIGAIPDYDSVGPWFSEYKDDIKKVTIGDGITKVGKNAFAGLTNLTNVTLGKDVKTIGDSAFFGCTSLKNIVIPDTVKSIGEDAFKNCNKSLTIDNKTDGSYAADYAYENGIKCSAISNAELAKGTVKEINMIIAKPEPGKKPGKMILSTVPANALKTMEYDTIGAWQVSTDGITYEEMNEDAAFEAGKYYRNSSYVKPVTLIVLSTIIEGKRSSQVNKDVTYGFDNNLKILINGEPYSDEGVIVDGYYHFGKCTIDISRAEVSGIADKKYTGKIVTQDIKVTLEGKTLIEGTDYSVAYKDNVDVGTATVTVKGEGIYGGEVIKTYKITSDNKANDGDEKEEVIAKSGVAGKGSSVSAVEKAIKSNNSEKELKGSEFGKLSARATKTTKKSVTIKWNKVKGAKGYIIYGAKCGKYNYQKLASLKAAKTSFVNKKLKKGTYYKFFVVAYDSSNKVVTSSRIIHAATTGGKVGNAKTIKVTNVKKNKKSLSKGKTFKLRVKQVAVNKKLKIKNHRKLSYETSNKKVATVTSKGKIKAVGKGSCIIYVYAQNGTFAKVKVTVK